MIRILHITVSSEIGGGPEHIVQLLSGLSTEVENYVACPNRGPYFNKFLSLVSGRLVVIPHRRLNLFSLIQLVLFIRSRNIQYVHTHGKGAAIYGKFCIIFTKVITVHTPHGISLSGGLMNRLYLFIERLVHVHPRTIVYVSESEHQVALSLSLWKSIPFRVILNGTKGISMQNHNVLRENARISHGLADQKIVISASRFDYQKNTIELCMAAELLQEIIFVIIGDGPERSSCELFCKNNRLTNVLFIGNTSKPLYYLAMSDVYLSTSRWEGLSMAIIEAMSLGLPILASYVPGNVDLVSHGKNGYLYNLGSLDEIGEYLTRIFLNYSYLSGSSKSIFEERYSSERMCRETHDLYMDLFQK